MFSTFQYYVITQICRNVRGFIGLNYKNRKHLRILCVLYNKHWSFKYIFVLFLPEVHNFLRGTTCSERCIRRYQFSLIALKLSDVIIPLYSHAVQHNHRNCGFRLVFPFLIPKDFGNDPRVISYAYVTKTYEPNIVYVYKEQRPLKYN